MEHDFDCFGSLVFDDRVMKAKLPAEVYQKLHRTIDEGRTLRSDVADAVAYLARAVTVTGQVLYVDGGQHLA